MAVTGRDLKLSNQELRDIEICIKIWNLSKKYLEMNGCHFDDEFDISGVEAPPNKWIIGKTQDILSSVNQSYEDFGLTISLIIFTITLGVFSVIGIFEFSKSLLNNEDEKTVQENTKNIVLGFCSVLEDASSYNALCD